MAIFRICMYLNVVPFQAGNEALFNMIIIAVRGHFVL